VGIGRRSRSKAEVEAEKSAFTAADALASNGHAVSVLIMPDGPAADAQGYAVLSGHIPPNRQN
jgi:hypothetical protein